MQRCEHLKHAASLLAGSTPAPHITRLKDTTKRGTSPPLTGTPKQLQDPNPRESRILAEKPQAALLPGAKYMASGTPRTLGAIRKASRLLLKLQGWVVVVVV